MTDGMSGFGHWSILLLLLLLVVLGIAALFLKYLFRGNGKGQ